LATNSVYADAGEKEKKKKEKHGHDHHEEEIEEIGITEEGSTESENVDELVAINNSEERKKKKKEAM
nr:hypothetical protein [bacterium]